MRRCVICLLLCVVMLLSAVTVFAAAQAAVLQVNVPDQLPKAGETFTVTVDISGNPGFSAAQLTLGYDKSAMKCEDISLDKVLNGMLAATNPDGKNGAIVAAASTSAVKKNGTMAVYTFTAVKDITDWKFSMTDPLLSSGDGKDLSVTVSLPEVNSQGPEKEDTGKKDPAKTEGKEQQSPDESEILPVSFKDTHGHWGEQFIARAVQLGLFNGYPDGTFRPDATISRADFVTVLWRASGSPEPTRAAAFKDVLAGAYYAKAVAWAKENGYVDGTSATTFDPAAPLQRQAAMKILFQYNGGMSGMEMMLTGVYNDAFADSANIASWAKPGMYWAYYNELIAGTGGSRLSPTTNVTRAQLAKILVNYLDKFGA